MLRSAWIFLAAILLPSLVLAWLAVRSARDQQVLLEHQQAIISQDVTDSLAKSVGGQIDAARTQFVRTTQELISRNESPLDAAYDFDSTLRKQWNLAEVGFAVDLRGDIYSPGGSGGAAARTFREENERFLTNRENAEVYSSLNSQDLFAAKTFHSSLPVHAAVSGAEVEGGEAVTVAATPPSTQSKSAVEPSSDTGAMGDAATASTGTEVAAAMMPPSTVSTDEFASKNAMKTASSSGPAAAMPESKNLEKTVSAPVPAAPPAESTGRILSITSPAEMPSAAAPSASATAGVLLTKGAVASDEMRASRLPQNFSQVARQVSPQNNFNANSAILSNTVPEESDFRRLIGSDSSGALARFLDNKLRLMVWYRPSLASDLVFGAQLSQSRLLDKLRPLLHASELQVRDGGLSSGIPPVNYCLALIDDSGRPVVLSIPGFTADWKHPFVATEIGETLPHWEAALYLTDPQQMSKSARTLRLTISLIVLLLMVAIVVGGSLIAADVRRKMRLAQQKTDFVSNVSHELKTPLTSIRMFADLLAEGRVTEPERQTTYLKIIAAESARLTRLINNVLDFARQERGAPEGERRPCDLVETARDVVEACLPHLESSGQNLSCEIEAESLPVIGDRDALAQIVLNLISNAEKYGGGEILVRVRRQETAGKLLGCVDVLDRGPGVPPQQVESIFLPFHRLHDSLSNGIPGSGLGLTLARRMARAHRGDITYSPRAGGGSCFTLTILLDPVSK